MSQELIIRKTFKVSGEVDITVSDGSDDIDATHVAHLAMTQFIPPKGTGIKVYVADLTFQKLSQCRICECCGAMTDYQRRKDGRGN